MNPVEKYSLITNDILEHQGTRLAFFKGSHKPDILIVGEAPGPNENIAGIPFVGPSGNLINELIQESNLSNFTISYLNVVFRMPLENSVKGFRKPTHSEIDFYRPMVKEIVNYLNPTCILLCGRSAAQSLLEANGIKKIRGQWFDNILASFHPSYVLRNPNELINFKNDFNALANRFLKTGTYKIDHKVNFKDRQTKMNDSAIINIIGKHCLNTAQELQSIYEYIASDPEVSVSKSRKLLEAFVSKLAHTTPQKKLNEQITALSPDTPDQILNKMHYIRKSGNAALHSDDKVDLATAKLNFEMLISIFCWHFNINGNDLEASLERKNPQPNSQQVQARFFIADEVHRTWPKIAVLTEDGVFYSQYLAWMKPVVFKKEGVDFDSFTAKDFSFGEQEHGSGYQSIREVSCEEASNFRLKSQENWINQYLREVGFKN